MELTDKLKELNGIDAINSGGCAIAAYALVEFLRGQNIHDATVVYLFGDYAENGKYRNVMSNDIESCHHAVVRSGDEYYDSKGIYYSLNDLIVMKGMPLSIEVSQDYVLDSINYGGWNNWFERWTGVPEIFRILGLGSELKNLIKQEEGRSYEG